MPRQRVRVVLASEFPQVRSFLSQVVEQEKGIQVVGQAQNAVEALTLATNLRPDILLVDHYLPHSVDLDSMPSTRVILLNNLDAVMSPDHSLSSNSASYSIVSNGATISLASPDLRPEGELQGAPLFASIEVKPRAALHQKANSVSDTVIFYGVLSFASGWLLTLTMILAPVGIPLALAGAATALIGLLGKLNISLWRRLKSSTKEASYKVR